MACGAYYNENDLKTAAWLRELITAGLIADGEVDTRSIADVHATDLAGFVQCHFFAGIGGWSYALRLAGWSDERPVWTGSCPCQPFSSAGAQAGGHDPRDLWPVWFELVTECRPGVLFGEQVEAAIKHGWFDRLCDDLEGQGYAVGAACLPAASVGAFHIRQRLWFVADTDEQRSQGRLSAELLERADQCASRASGASGNVADAHRSTDDAQLQKEQRDSVTPQRRGETCRSGRYVASGIGWQRKQVGHWGACDWIPCRDGKWRPVEPGTQPLVAGLPKSLGRSRHAGELFHPAEARMMRLRGYGNAIVPAVAAAFIAAYMEITCS